MMKLFLKLRDNKALLSNMDNLKELEKFVNSLGWFGGTAKLSISLERAFEGFSGRASETWESQVVIELSVVKEAGKIICPSIKVIGKQYCDIDTVAGQVLQQLKEWKQNPVQVDISNDKPTTL